MATEVWDLIRRARATSVRAGESTDSLRKPDICAQLTHTLSYSLLLLQEGVVYTCRYRATWGGKSLRSSTEPFLASGTALGLV